MAEEDPFKTGTVKAGFDLPKTMAWAQRHHGKGRLRQLAEMTALALPPHRMVPQEYYHYALFRRGFGPAERRQFLSDAAGTLLNRRLSPRGTGQHRLLQDKLLTSHVLNSAGFPVVPVLAVYSAGGGFPGQRALGSAEAIATFLREEAELPIFGKPLVSSIGIGGASFVAREPGGAIRLGDGRIFPAEALAAAIVRHYPGGYLFQPLIRQHPDAAAVTGPATGILRVVTLWEEGGPQILYTAQKLPSPGSMIDSNTESLGSGFALVDAVSGVILRAQSKLHLNLRALETSPVTGLPLVGHVLPDVAASVTLAREAHRLFPGHGLLGFDIPATGAGPVILEINTNPFHMLYQRAADRGIMAPGFAERIRAVEAARRR